MPTQKIVIINGSGGCGKSTFASLCIEEGAKENRNTLVLELSSVDYVKEVAKFCRWDGEKREKDRAFLHDLKMALDSWDNIPNKKVFSKITSILSDGQFSKDRNLVFFVNIREPECIESFVKGNSTNVDVITLLIKNSNVPRIFSNAADREVENYRYDYTINNNGTIENLREEARNFLSKII